MNKYFRIIAAIFAVASSFNSFAMLTRVKSDPLGRSFHQHVQMRDHLHSSVEKSIHLGTHQEVVHLAKKQPWTKTVNSFNALPKTEQCKALSGLTDLQQAALLMEQNPDAALHILPFLFDGDKEVAKKCDCEPSACTMNSYADYTDAKVRMNKYPNISWNDINFTEKHYTALTDEQAAVFYYMSREKRLYNRTDVEEVVDAFVKLQEVDPEMKCLKSVTNNIKLYPSFRERVGYFCDAQGNSAEVCICTGGFGVSATVNEIGWYMLKDKLKQKNLKSAIELYSYFRPFAAIGLVFSAGFYTGRKHGNYQFNLENNILPNQPSLTDFLHEKAEQTKKSKES